MLRLQLGQLGAQPFQFCVVRGHQGCLLLAQALFALRKLGEYFQCVFAARLRQLQRLHVFGGFQLQPVALNLAGAKLLLGDWQLRRSCAGGGLADVGLLPRARLFLPPFILAGALRLQLGFTLFELVLQGGQLVADALAVFTHVLELLLHARKFRVRFIQAAVCRMHGVAGGVMAVAQFFDAALGFAHARGFGFQLYAQLLDFTRMTFARARRLAFFLQPQQVLRQVQLLLQAVVLARHFRLLAQMLELLVEFEADVLHAQQVFACIAQSQLGFTPAFAVFRNTRRLFEEDAQFFGFRFNDARNHALLDDGVGARAQTGAEENIGDIAPPHVQIVDVIRRLAVALKHTLDRNFAVACPLAAGPAETVVEHQLDARAIRGLAVARAVEQHVLHGLAAQMFRRRFAKHPAHRVNDVRFAAAVGADHADQLAGHGNAGGIYKRLEACELDFSEAQFVLCSVR